VDDDGFGYRDHGGEIWEVDEEREDKQKKRRKLDKNEQMITEFMGPESMIKKSNLNVKPKNALPKVSAAQSKDIMDNLLKQLDNKDDLEDVHQKDYLAEISKPISFNKED
jgi:hypothetical protein